MTITLEDLNHIRKECDNLSTIIKTIVSSYRMDNNKRKLFVSRRDYEESLKLKNEIPQDFYYFRCFDVFLQICFNTQSKKYYIYLDGFYSEILNKYKKINNSDKSFEIGSSFNIAFEVFHDLIEDIYRHKILQNGLF